MAEHERMLWLGLLDDDDEDDDEDDYEEGDISNSNENNKSWSVLYFLRDFNQYFGNEYYIVLYWMSSQGSKDIALPNPKNGNLEPS